MCLFSSDQANFALWRQGVLAGSFTADLPANRRLLFVVFDTY